jgi:hypothetical protein
MTENEEIAKVLKTRLSELTGHLAEIDSELRKRLSADSEERATDLEIRMRSRASKILKFKKSVRFKGR